MWLDRATVESQKEMAVAETSAVESASNGVGNTEEEVSKCEVLLQENKKRILAMFDRDQRWVNKMRQLNLRELSYIISHDIYID